MVLKGFERRADQGGRRWAKGEVRLKFVVKVNVARLVNTPCLEDTCEQFIHFIHSLYTCWIGRYTIAIQT